MKLGLFGRGRMGGPIAAAARAAGVDVAWQLGRDGEPSGPVDVAIDASIGSAVAAHVDWALSTRTPLVIGTSAWQQPERDELARRVVAAGSAVLIAPSFSLGVLLQRRLALVLARFAQQDAVRDLYLLEHHHSKKKDAPSGTARMLAATLLKGCPRKTRWAAPSADQPIGEDTLSVSSIRAGHTWSTHVIGVDAPGEALTLHHEARSAEPYARGALHAAAWLIGRRGLFTMDDVARDVLDPLFMEIEP